VCQKSYLPPRKAAGENTPLGGSARSGGQRGGADRGLGRRGSNRVRFCAVMGRSGRTSPNKYVPVAPDRLLYPSPPPSSRHSSFRFTFRNPHAHNNRHTYGSDRPPRASPMDGGGGPAVARGYPAWFVPPRPAAGAPGCTRHVLTRTRRGPGVEPALEMACYCDACAEPHEQRLSQALVGADGHHRRQGRLVRGGGRPPVRRCRGVRHKVSLALRHVMCSSSLNVVCYRWALVATRVGTRNSGRECLSSPHVRILV
jgi:hypothetical protein